MNVLILTKLILNLAIRNIRIYSFRSSIIACLLGFGSFLAVLGLSLLNDIERSMRESITASVAGDLQVYSSKAKDKLALFGSMMMGRSDVGVIPDISKARELLLSHNNVKNIVPMGIDMALLSRGNELDDSFAALRHTLREGDSLLIDEQIEQIKFQVEQMKASLAELRKIVNFDENFQEQEKNLEIASSSEFLASLKANDELKLQFLETKIAPISGEKLLLYLMYLGTDIELFENNFKKFKIVEGQSLPIGKRGILISQKVREDQLKNITARLLDKINKRINIGRQHLKGDPENERFAANLLNQHQQIIAYLDRKEAEELSSQFNILGITGQTTANSQEEKPSLINLLTRQIKEFFALSDDNFHERYAWYYQHIAPKIKLYEYSPGETIVLRSYTRSGYIKTVPLQIYGIYTFTGLEDSDVAGSMNIIDLLSFRELYGQMNEASLKELEKIRQEAGIRDIDQGSIEDQLFGEANAASEPSHSSPPSEAEVKSQKSESHDGNEAREAREPIQLEALASDQFDPAEIKRGLALNLAIILKDSKMLKETEEQLNQLFKDNGSDLQVIDWQEATGMIGQFVNIVRLVLLFAITVIFVVALVIINNSVIVSTLQRIRDIGTMRAIGAQKSFIISLFLAETTITGIIGATAGAILAFTVLSILGQNGLSSGFNDFVTFLFSGPRLYPSINYEIILFLPIIITALATLATIYAARHAAHIKPIEALTEKE